MIFSYRGRDHSQQLVEGQIDASHRQAAISQLQQQGIILLGLVEGAGAHAEKKHTKKTPAETAPATSATSRSNQKTAKKWYKPWASPISPDELILLTRQLQALTKAGIPIIRALEGLSQSSANTEVQAVLQGIARSLIGGSDLASAFRQYPQFFSPIYISMIHIGETTGRLDGALLKLVAHLELERETKKRMKAALRYPLMVVLAISVAMVVITLFVIPGFTNVFDKLGAELPWATQMLISISEFMQHYWGALLVLAIAGGVGVKRYRQTPAGQLWWDKHKLRWPFIGSIFERIALARFSRSFAMMMASGVPILQCLAIVADSLGNQFIGGAVRDMQNGVERGERLTSTAQQTGLFTPLVLQMLAVGEETGSVDKLLDDVADFYEQEVDYELKQLADAIEPVLLVFLGVLVLILALGVFLPIWQLSGVATG